MAEIPVEKKSGGIPWWVWLLLLLLLAAILWFVLAGDDDDAVVDDTDEAALIADPDDDDRPEVTDAAGPVITDLALITSTSDGSLEGREVNLTGVTAGSVPEDAGFWIMARSDSADQDRVWVVLEEVLTPDTPIEGRVDVDKGDAVDITGVMRRAESGAPVGAAIPGPTAELPDDIQHFIYASKVVQSGS